jgi:aspartyl-tRNA(Asn)/glutamyl-tRNA(Gln) amidotransferase subunit C
MDVAELRHVAELAELSLTAEEEERLAGEIGHIVAYVRELDGVDTTGVPPTAHMTIVAGHDAFRRDMPVDGLSHEEALREAPAEEHGGFSVPSFVR